MWHDQSTEWSALRHDADLHLDVFQAHFTTYAFARHWHDYYVIGLVEAGAQSFWCRNATYITPPGGLILLNPGDPHTGQAAVAAGFAYRALYPTFEHMAQAMAEFGRPNELPRFPAFRIDDPDLAEAVRALQHAIGGDHATIERESRWLALLTALIRRYGADRPELPATGNEPRAVARVRAYVEAHYAERVTLANLAAEVGLSPFHLVRVFGRAAGMPPHVYLESVRVRHAQRLLAADQPPADVAYATGFSSQSHFTSRFRQIIGVTPAVYRAMHATLHTARL
jgi:AraC-like DNA-binding protein